MIKDPILTPYPPHYNQVYNHMNRPDQVGRVVNEIILALYTPTNVISRILEVSLPVILFLLFCQSVPELAHSLAHVGEAQLFVLLQYLVAILL